MSFGTLTTMLNTPLNTPTTTIIHTFQREYEGPSAYHLFYIKKFENKYSFIYSPKPNRSYPTLKNIIVINSAPITQFQPATFKVSKFLGDNGFLLNEFDDENVAKKFMKDTTEKLNVDKRRIIFFPDNPDFIQNFVLYGYSY
jgi:hypothetical protein